MASSSSSSSSPWNTSNQNLTLDDNISDSTEKLEAENSLANAWNNYQLALKKKGITGNYKQMWATLSHAEKERFAGSKRQRIKINVRCCLTTFTDLVKECKLDSSNILDDSPFKWLLKLVDYRIDKALILEIASNFNVKEKSLMVGATKHTLDAKDFNYILNIFDGTDHANDHKPSGEFVRKFCSTKDPKIVCMKKVMQILEHKNDKVDVERAFAIVALKYVVCVPARGMVGVHYLKYVEDAHGIERKPWATIAMAHLIKGIDTYQKGKGKAINLGGSMVFLQLYYLNKLTNMEPEELLSHKKKDDIKALVEKGKEREAETVAPPPKRKRGTSPLLEAIIPETRVTVNLENEGVGPPAHMEVNHENEDVGPLADMEGARRLASSGTKSSERKLEIETPSFGDKFPFKISNTTLWKTIESMEAFIRIPQKPHFRPLEGMKENSREGIAIATMATFSSVMDKTCALRFEDPKSAIEGLLETLVELEPHGFEVDLIRDRLTRLLLMKDKKEEELQLKLEMEEKRIDAEIGEIEREMMELEERRRQLLSTKSKMGLTDQQLRQIGREFHGLAAAPWV